MNSWTTLFHLHPHQFTPCHHLDYFEVNPTSHIISLVNSTGFLIGVSQVKQAMAKKVGAVNININKPSVVSPLLQMATRPRSPG